MQCTVSGDIHNGAHGGRGGGRCDDRSTGPEKWTTLATHQHSGLEEGQQSQQVPGQVSSWQSEDGDPSLAIQQRPGLPQRCHVW